jgi:hydrogenase nickel incorporation protein HypA/HybF
MHEFGIASSIVDTVVAQSAGLVNGSRVVKVGVMIGDLSGVDVEALKFSFDAIVAGSDLAPLEIEIERRRHRRRCGDCHKEFDVDVMAFDARCPACANSNTEFLAGDELEILYLEVEDC